MPKFTENEYKKYTNNEKAKYNSPDEEYQEYTSKNKKICSKCGEEKDLIKFNTNTSSADGFNKDGYRLRRPECYDCTKIAQQGKDRAKKLAKEMCIPYTAPQGELCSICGLPEKSGDKLVFDHCHKTTTFRGYLHNSCNRSLGVLGDNLEGIIKALNYLNKFEKKKIIYNENIYEIHIAED